VRSREGGRRVRVGCTGGDAFHSALEEVGMGAGAADGPLAARGGRNWEEGKKCGWKHVEEGVGRRGRNVDG